MKISELINELEKAREEWGDLEMFTLSQDDKRIFYPHYAFDPGLSIKSIGEITTTIIEKE